MMTKLDNLDKLFIVWAFLLVAGVKTISLLLPLTDIKDNASFKDKYLIVLLGMCSLIFIRFIHSFIHPRLQLWRTLSL